MRIRSPMLISMKEMALVDNLDRSKRSIKHEKLKVRFVIPGLHACGMIIAPDDLTNHIPVAAAKDSDLLVTQFDNAVVESAGLLKMDFLGLKTLSIIKDAIKLIKEKHGISIDPDEIPL